MAATALQPRCASANPLRDHFDAALKHFVDEKTRQANLPGSRSIEQDLAAADAVERALDRLIATPAPDLWAISRKLHVALSASGAPYALIAALQADVRRAAEEARA